MSLLGRLLELPQVVNEVLERKEDNGSQLHLNLSKPITQKDMERHQKYFERAVEYAAEKEKENDQNILFGMLIIIIVFLLIFGLTVASR